MNETQEFTDCNHCTYALVDLAYKRAPWFRLIREPIILGLRIFVFVHQVTVDEYRMKTPFCNGCIRFYKSALFKKSPVFRWLHSKVNPIWSFFLNRVITREESNEASVFAKKQPKEN